MWDGDYKNHYRYLLSEPGRVYNSVFTLPGLSCKCVNYLMANGHINNNTSIVMAEIGKSVYQKAHSLFKRKYAHHFRKYRFLNEDYTLIHNEIGNVSVAEICSYDLVNLDTTGSLNDKTLNFIKKLCFYPNARLIVNLCDYRNNFYFLNKLTNHYYCNNSDSFLKIQNSYSCKTYKIQITLTALYDALIDAGCTASINAPVSYTDKKVEMTTYIFSNINKCGDAGNKFNPQETEEISFPGSIYSKSKLDKSCMTALILSAVSVGEISYVKSCINQELKKVVITGKSPKMIIAGYKAELTKRGVNPEDTLLADYSLSCTNNFSEQITQEKQHVSYDS